MNLGKETLQDLTERPRERLIMGEYGEMSNHERAVRVYVALALAVPFVNLLVTSSPTAGRAIVALVSFGLAFIVGGRAFFETLHGPDHAGDPGANVDESYTTDSGTDPLAEEGSS